MQVFDSGTRRKGLPKGLGRRLGWGVPVRLSPVRALVGSSVGWLAGRFNTNDAIFHQLIVS